MSLPPPRQRGEPRYDGESTERRRSYIGFWLGAALAVFGLGVGTFAAVGHGRGIGVALMCLAAACLAMALLVRRAARRERD